MKSTAFLGMGLLVAAMMVGCGDDGGDDGPMCEDLTGSGTPDPICSPLQPDPGQVAAVGTDCCARVDNSSDLTDYTLRLTALTLSSPSTLASPVVAGLLNRSLDLEGFNWLIHVTGTGGDGAVLIETGFGIRDTDGVNSTYHFYDDAVDGPDIVGSSPAWEPVIVMGTQTSNDIVSQASPQSFTVPVFNEAELLCTGDLMVDLELPLQALQLDSMNSGADGTCVGDRDPCVVDPSSGDTVCTGFDTSQASVTTYIGVAEADLAVIQVPPLDGVSLCALISENQNTVGCTAPATRCCASADPSTWPASATELPDSLCMGMAGCIKDPGDGSVCSGGMTPPCNAWELKANLSAHGVGLTTP